MSITVQRSEAAELVKSPLWELNAFAVPPPAVYGYTSIVAAQTAWSVRDFNQTIAGLRYKQMTGVNNTVLVGGGFGTPANITGELVIDGYNGSIVSHRMDQPPPGTVLTVGNGSCLPWSDPTRSITGDTSVVWTDGATTFQSINLTDPTTLGDITVLVTELLDAVVTDANKDTCTLPANTSWITGYDVSANPFMVAGLEYWLPTWINDPLGGGVIGAWVNPMIPGAVILDRDIPADEAHTSFLTDLGIWTPGTPGDPVSGPQTNVAFSQAQFMTWTAGRLLVRTLTPSSSHCITEQYDANAQTAGNVDNALSLDADASGILLVNEPGLAVNAGLDEEAGKRLFYHGYHPSGITCVP